MLHAWEPFVLTMVAATGLVALGLAIAAVVRFFAGSVFSDQRSSEAGRASSTI